MRSFNLGVLASLVVSATCFPFHFPLFEENTLAVRAAANNCTQYCSVSAGCVCTVRPSDCTALYTVKPDDTCGSIAKHFNNFTTTQLYKWNPDIGQTCFGLQAYVPICIDTPWYKFTPPVQASYGTVEATKKTPVPIMPSITSKCAKFELVGPGITVADMAKTNKFSAAKFPLWNGNATTGWQDYWACVGV